MPVALPSSIFNADVSRSATDGCRGGSAVGDCASAFGHLSVDWRIFRSAVWLPAGRCTDCYYATGTQRRPARSDDTTGHTTAGDTAEPTPTAGAAQQGTAQQNTPTRTAQKPQQSTPQKNLIAESASTLGKVIAGFTLAKAGPLIQHFHRICDTVAPALCHQSCDGGLVLAGAIILYFFATGFFSGLLLPSYFMSGKFG
jgi:hypothetical protein